MHPLDKQLPHDCGIGEPAFKQKVTGFNPGFGGLSHHLDQNIGCLTDRFPAPLRPVGATVKIGSYGS